MGLGAFFRGSLGGSFIRVPLKGIYRGSFKGIYRVPLKGSIGFL